MKHTEPFELDRAMEGAALAGTAVSSRNHTIDRVGPRIQIRAHVPEDFRRMREIWAHPDVMRHMSVGPMSDSEAARAFNVLLEPDPFARQSWRFAIVLRSTDTLLGTIGLDFERFASGYTHSMVTHPDGWRRGLATEAYDMVLAFAFDEHRIKRIWTACSTENDAGKRLIARVGFHQFGMLEEYVERNGHAVDCCTFSLLARDWHDRIRAEKDRRSL